MSRAPWSSPEGTVSGLLRRLAADRPDAEALVFPAFVHGGRRLSRTFADLDARVDALARGLIALGIGPGEKVALWAGNVPDWVPLEFALARAGAVLVTVNTALKGDEVAYVLRQSGAVAVLHTTRTGSNEASATLDRLLEDPRRPLAGLRHRVWLPATPDDRPPEGLHPSAGDAPTRGPLPTLDEVAALGDTVAPREFAAREFGTRPGDVVNIQYTSGTTGFPKGVMLSHRNVLASAVDLGDEVHVGPEDRTALMVPLFHCFGCVVAVLGTFTYGATLCCIPGFDPEAALRLVHEERCTLIHGVPTMYSAMLHHPERARYDCTSLRAGLVAGAPCPVPLMVAIEEQLPCPGILVAYGLTEASPGVSGARPEDPREARCATIGRPLPQVEVAIVDPASGTQQPPGKEGEIRVRGPNVMLGYHDDPPATAAAITADGWLRTGDLGLLGADGNLRVVGRIKDLVIRGGENIAPAEIEGVLREHPEVVDAAVVGVPDEHFGEELAAVLVLAPGATLDPPSYEALLSGRVAAFKVPKIWRAVTALPLTGSGKVQKYKLRQQLAAELG